MIIQYSSMLPYSKVSCSAMVIIRYHYSNTVLRYSSAMVSYYGSVTVIWYGSTLPSHKVSCSATVIIRYHYGNTESHYSSAMVIQYSSMLGSTLPSHKVSSFASDLRNQSVYSIYNNKAAQILVQLKDLKIHQIVNVEI